MISVDGGTREQRDLAEEAAAVVEKHVGRIGHVRLVFTDSRGMAGLSYDAEIALMPQMSASVRNDRIKDLRREARDAAGSTKLDQAPGSTLVLLNTAQCRGRELGKTLVHEFTHSWQLAQPQARNAHLRYLRHACGIEAISEHEFRQYMRHMDQQEKEGKRAERLARHLK